MINFESNGETVIGIEEGGIKCIEGLLLSRYFMYSQVYWHPIRKVYDVHLEDIMGKLFEDYRIEDLKVLTDVDVLHSIDEICKDKGHDLYELALRIKERRHFRKVFSAIELQSIGDFSSKKSRKKADLVLKEFQNLREALSSKLGSINIRDALEKPKDKPKKTIIPVLTSNGEVQLANEITGIYGHIPDVVYGFIYVHPEKKDAATKIINKMCKKGQ